MQRDQPEIAVPEVAADTSRKVDVVNQKLANFGTAGSTTKFGDRKFRSVGQRNAAEYESTNTIQQLAIYAEPSNGADFKERKNRGSPERGRDSLRSSSQFVLPGEIHRAERIGRGMIEFVARDDANVAAYYRCYTSPRHCYRLPPPRTRQLPLLLATYGPNRYISVPTRAIAACVANNSKPPIREPNMPEKCEREDERKRDKKNEPVIRTECKSIDSSESRAAMEAEDNPTSDPDAPFRYKWGVKLAEEEPAEASDNDNFAEKGRRYVTKRLWGVNMTHPDVGGAAPPTSESAHEHQNVSQISESEDAAEEVGRAKGQVPLKSKTALAKGQGEANWRTQDDESFSAWTDRDWSSASEDFAKSERETSDTSLATNSQTLKKILKAMPGMSRETSTPEDNASEEATSDAEISAWQNLAMKAKPAMLAILSATRSQKLEKVSIRPEAPQQKLDVRVVKSIEDIAQESKNEQSAGFKLSSMGLKRIGSTETPNLDNFSPSKKLHTASAPIHCVLRDVNDVTRQGFRSLPVSRSCAGGNAQVKDSGITLAFSTDCGGSEEEKISDNVSTKQDERETDLKSLNEERSSNDSPKGAFLFSTEPQTALCDDQKQLDVEVDVTTNTIADEETEMSTRQSRDADCENADRASVSTVRHESRGEGKNICGETRQESYEGPYTDYNYRDSHDVGHNVANTDPTKSHEAAESIFAGAKNTVPDSNAEDASDFGEQYVTDGDYTRVPGDPYPYSKENLVKWRMPIKRQTLLSRLPRDRSTPRNANDAYANAAGQSYGSHAVGMETSGSGDGAMDAKNVGLASGFRASSRNQRVVAPDCDAGDALKPRGSTEASSRLDNLDNAATTSRKTSEAERGDNASLRAYHQ